MGPGQTQNHRQSHHHLQCTVQPILHTNRAKQEHREDPSHRIIGLAADSQEWIHRNDADENAARQDHQLEIIDDHVPMIESAKEIATGIKKD